MRITIDFSRSLIDRVPRIRMKWQSSGKDDLRMQHLGIALYEELDRNLSNICNKLNHNTVVYENRGMVQ